MEFDPITIETRDESTYWQAIEARNLFPRQDSENSNCVQCQDAVLRCSDECYAKKGWECKQIIPVSDCTTCPSTKCVESASPADSLDSDTSSSGGGSGSGGGGGPNVAVIAGSTVGGVVVVAILTYLLWRFCIKPRRQQEGHSMPPNSLHESKTDNADRPGYRSSMHTVHSVASTVLTRASNIIQIAYMPNSHSSSSSVPPVPSIPSQFHSGSGYDPTSPHSTAHRESTFSDMTGYTDDPNNRASVATTVYTRGPIFVNPHEGMRAKPAVINVRGTAPTTAANSKPSSGATTPNGTFASVQNPLQPSYHHHQPPPGTLPGPLLAAALHAEKNNRRKSIESTFSVGSTFLHNNVGPGASATAINTAGLSGPSPTTSAGLTPSISSQGTSTHGGSVAGGRPPAPQLLASLTHGQCPPSLGTPSSTRSHGESGVPSPAIRVSAFGIPRSPTSVGSPASQSQGPFSDPPPGTTYDDEKIVVVDAKSPTSPFSDPR